MQRHIQHVRLQGNVEPIAVPFLAHSLKPLSHALRVTMGTAFTDLRAAGYRIPSRFGPLDGRGLSHVLLLSVREGGKDNNLSAS